MASQKKYQTSETTKVMVLSIIYDKRVFLVIDQACWSVIETSRKSHSV